jgi:hypothetical protein
MPARHFGGGMGSHKHGVSGRAGPTGFNKLLVNKTTQELRKRKRRPGKMYDSIAKLMKGER